MQNEMVSFRRDCAHYYSQNSRAAYVTVAYPIKGVKKTKAPLFPLLDTPSTTSTSNTSPAPRHPLIHAPFSLSFALTYTFCRKSCAFTTQIQTHHQNKHGGSINNHVATSGTPILPHGCLPLQYELFIPAKKQRIG